MGNHDVGRAFSAAADVFWIVCGEGEEPAKEMTLRALEAVGEYFQSSMDAEFDDALYTHTTPLGRMVAIAFDAMPDEMLDDDADAVSYTHLVAR